MLVLLVVISENCCMFLLETDISIINISIIINQVSHDTDQYLCLEVSFSLTKIEK